MRLANVTGPRLAIGPIPTFYTRLKSGKSCFCSRTVRDLIDMEDFFAITDLALQDGAPTGRFNVSTGTGHTIREIFDLVADHLGLDANQDVPEVDPGPDDVAKMVLDPSETEAAFDWRPRYSFEETIRRMLVWYDIYGVTTIYSHVRRPDAVAQGDSPAMTDSFEGANIAVVGGAGFVGSNLVKAILDQQPRRLTIVDNFLSADPVNVPDYPAVKLVASSVTDERVLRGLDDDLDYVFHLACYHGNQSSIADPIADHDNNTLTSLKLFERLKEIKTLRKVVYAAAGCAVAEKTFDGATATTEDAPVSLYHDSPYSISKLVGEMYGNYYWARYGLPFVKARFQNVYGPGEILGAGRWRGTPHTVWRNVTPTFIWRSLYGEALPVENGGIASRDFIFVEDMARGLMACALKGGPGEIYNLGSGVETTVRELAERINRLTGNQTPIALTPARDWDRSGQRFANTTKALEKLGFEAQVDHETGIARTVEWTRANKADIIRCMKQHRHFGPEVMKYG
ncbi:MAG: NAD-dependent epimerase/dehydratase family protein [Oricola sp.]